MVHVCRFTADGGTAIARYNSSVPAERQIRVGDYFTSVNGVSYESLKGQSVKVSEALREQLLQSLSSQVKVARPHEFSCKVEKKGLPMGLELSYSNNGTGLIIA